MSVGGASWALRVLRESSFSENKALQESFTSALTQVKLREIRAVIESCRRYTNCIVNMYMYAWGILCIGTIYLDIAVAEKFCIMLFLCVCV